MFRRRNYIFYRCLEFVLHEYLGYLSLNYPKFKFYGGRWFTKLQWEASERQALLRQKILKKHFPEIYDRQIEAVKYLMDNPLPLLTRDRICQIIG